MPGCARIAGSIHMTMQTEVLIDTLKALSSDLPWCSCNIFSPQENTVAVINYDEYDSVFSWKGDST